MPTVTEKYLGGLKVECTHVASGTQIITDAPVDNGGKGEAFSPTDLCATALGACAVTIMGKFADNHKLDISGTTIEINKIMGANPRRIAKIELVFHMPDRKYSAEEKAGLEEAATTCPVCKSLGADVEKDFKFIWH